MLGSPKNLTESLFPLLSMNAFIGHGIFPFPAHKPRLVLSVIWTVVCTSLYIVVLGFTLNSVFSEPWYGDDERVAFIAIYVNVGIAIINIILSWYHAKEMTKVDETLQELGSTFNYTRTRNIGYGLILIWIVTIIAFNSVDSLWFCNMISFRRSYSIASVLHHPVHMNSIVVFNFCVGVRHVNLELRRIGKGLGDAYGIQMAFDITALFVTFSALLYELYILAINPLGYSRNYRIIVIGAWVFIYFIKLIMINEICEAVCSEARHTGEIIHSLDENIEDSELTNEIKQFSLQLKQDPVIFSPVGLVTLGHKFVRSFLATVTTYLVILIQMRPFKADTAKL